MAKAQKTQETSTKPKWQQALDELNKTYGAGTVISGKDKPLQMEVISTGSLYIDIALGIGGLPKGRIVEVIGPESSGKSTLCWHVVANAQKEGIKCLVVDAEHAISVEYAKSLGVDLEDLILSQPDYGEQGLEVAKKLIQSGEIGCVIVDSVAALTPKAEMDGTVGDQKPGIQARMMGQTLRMITASAEKYGALVIFTNQLRDKIGVMYGSPETTAGGNALKFYASVRIDMRKTVDAENSQNKTRVKIIKSKVSPPMKTCEVNIKWGIGFDRLAEVIDMAVDLEILKKAGSWIKYGETNIAQGMENTYQLARDNSDWFAEIEGKVMEKLKE